MRVSGAWVFEPDFWARPWYACRPIIVITRVMHTIVIIIIISAIIIITPSIARGREGGRRGLALVAGLFIEHLWSLKGLRDTR